MIHSTQGAAAPVLSHTQAAAPRNLAQHRAILFVSAMIASGDASQWNGGYIHGLIQALSMAGVITVEHACKLEEAQEQASLEAFNRRAIGGAA